MASSPPSFRRSNRSTRLTQKAQEIAASGEEVPGFTCGRDQEIETGAAAPGSLDWTGMMSTSKRRRTQGPVAEDATRTSFPLPNFGPDALPIYRWQISRLKDFLKLTDAQQQEKRRMDMLEKAGDIDDGGDDWNEFEGDRNAYPEKEGIFCLERCIASAFVNRAKRAFWTGKSWKTFELEERSVDSEAHVRAEKDPKRRALLNECALDNDLRLAVFDAIKHRLCQEIWLAPYEASKVAVTSRQDSIVPMPVQRNFDSTAAEKARGIVGWTRDEWDYLQPRYGVEEELPSGMRNFMRDMRMQEATSQNRGSIAAPRATETAAPRAMENTASFRTGT